MIGAIAGDIIGSTHERSSAKSLDFPLFSDFSGYTDETILTLATAEAVLKSSLYQDKYRKWFKLYPSVVHNNDFSRWARHDDLPPYGGTDCGAAARVSPVAWAFDRLEDALSDAEESARCTHNSPDATQAAQAVACVIHMARHGESAFRIRRHVAQAYRYPLSASLEQIRPTYAYETHASATVPQAITAALESTSWEHAVRCAISLGGNCNALASLAGAMAEALHGGVPAPIVEAVRPHLDDRMRRIVTDFRTRYRLPDSR